MEVLPYDMLNGGSSLDENGVLGSQGDASRV
jgi:hypothetical protein